jgi:DNA-binding MarR family transcriptional regulator
VRRTPPVSAARELLRTMGLMRRVMHPHFARLGISLPQWAVLHTLYEAERDGPEGVRLKDLAGCLLVRPPSVTAAVDRLQRGGLVARHGSDGDRRVKRAHLTGRGRRMVRKVQAGHRAHLDRLLGGLTRIERTELQRLLHRLRSHLEGVLVQENGPGSGRGGPAWSTPPQRGQA